jgi:predicted dithiol-disulfide oxidoreductase (DUF899 family)
MPGMPAIITDEIADLESQIADLKKRLTEARRRAPAEQVADLPLLRRDGTPTRLSDCFGGKPDLLVIHNMGRRCVYCTLWADGLIGSWPHLNDRAGFVLVSEDEPAVLDAFATSREWPFPVASMHGTDFANALGVGYDGSHQKPGVSAFERRADGSIVRTGYAPFGPGDDFCAAWPLFDLLAGGASGWEPKYAYRQGNCGPGCCCSC